MVVSEAVAVCDISGLRRFLIRVGYGLGSGDHSNRIVTLFTLPYGAPCGAPLDLVNHVQRNLKNRCIMLLYIDFGGPLVSDFL